MDSPRRDDAPSPALARLHAALAGRYRIERELGQGGMATVYLAHDIKHERKVALKVLKPELAAVIGAERFVVEIRTTAALQHPNILPLFDSGEAEGFLYYVMPFIDGETLRAKLDRETQLGVDESVQLTRDVADALHYAHARGVIHRDIKPENILLANGRPMVADFGIALALSAAAGGRMTETGLSLGTPHYMSPEQATAEKDITARSDVYSLASVLYEMLAGTPPHTGASAQQIIMKIVTEEAAPVTKLRKTVPPNVAAAVAKAIEKLPADRFDTAKAFADALSNPTFHTTASGSSSAPRAFALSYAPSVNLVLAAATLAFAAIAAWALFKPSATTDPAPVRFSFTVPTGMRMLEDETPNIAISPDGRIVVYETAGMLHRRDLESETSKPMVGTEGGYFPFFSHDGTSLAFSRGDGIHYMSIDGGPVTRFTNSSYLGAAWAEDGSIVHSTRGGLWRTVKPGDKPVQLTTLGPGETEHVFPDIVDGGRVLIFTVLGNTALWGDARVVALELASGERTVIQERATYGRFAAPNRVLYVDGSGTLSAIEFDARRMTTTGQPVPVTTGVRVATWGGAGSYAVSASGTLTFIRGSSYQSNIVSWVDRSGRRTQLGEPMSPATLLISPDGRRILVDPFLPSSLDVWLMDAVTGARDRFTFAEPGTVSNESPVWSYDGRRVAYAFQIGDSMRVHSRKADGSADTYLFTRPHHHHLNDWSPDGKWLVVTDLHPERRGDVIAVRVDSASKTVVLAGTPHAEDNARLSPDGRWAAYNSDESGRTEVYVVAFPSGDGRRQVSTNGGRLPRWSRTSGELFYWRDSTLMAVPVTTAGTFERGTPKALFTMADADATYARWDAAANGQRFLIATHNPNSLSREIHVVIKWDGQQR